MAISPGMTNTVDCEEMSAIDEYTTHFDVYTTVRLPDDSCYTESNKMIRLRIHLDIEMQRDSNPGYELSSRGV